jgi:hypothetical protein
MKSLVNSHGQMVSSPKLFWMAIGCWLKVSTVMQSKFQTWFDFFLKISPIFFGSQIFYYKRCSDRIVLLIQSAIPENHNTKSADYWASFSCMLRSFE